jgi:hypothetical protein
MSLSSLRICSPAHRKTTDDASRRCAASFPKAAVADGASGAVLGLFHPSVAELDAVIAAQLLVEILHIENPGIFLIRAPDSLDLLNGYSFRTRMSPPVKQPRVSTACQPSSPSPHCSDVNTQNLSSLPPRYSFRHRPHDHFLHFHRTLHFSFRVLLLHHVTSVVQSLPSAAVKSGQFTC